MSSIQQVSQDVSGFTGRLRRIQVFWDYRQRFDFEDDQFRADAGLIVQPKPGKYYVLQGNNLGAREDRDVPGTDFEKRNTFTGLIGKDFGPLGLYAGVIRSAGGGRIRYRPLPKASGWNHRLEVEAEAYDFARDEVIHGVLLDKPVYNVGARVNLVDPWVWLGGQVEDVAERKNFNANLNVTFKDDDIAFLLGFVGLAR